MNKIKKLIIKGLEAATLEVISDNRIIIFGGRSNNGDSD